MVGIFFRLKQVVGDLFVDIILGVVSFIIETTKIFENTSRITLATIGCVLLLAGGALQYTSNFGEYPKILFGVSLVIYTYLTYTWKWLQELARPTDINRIDI